MNLKESCRKLTRLCHSAEVIYVDNTASTTPEKELRERSR